MWRCSALFLLFSLVGSNAAGQDAEGVRSDSAIAVHAGVAYARLPDVDFEVVRALSGQDLFAQVSARESTTDFAVFVSQRLWANQNGDARAYASLGTGLNDPGTALYFGGSLGVSRALVTVGVATTLVDEGVVLVPDQVFRGSGDRQLFSSLEPSRMWGLFASVSFGLIQ